MRGGYRIFDADTHILPCAEVLERYFDRDLSERHDALACYRVAGGRAPGTTLQTHEYRAGTRSLRRFLGRQQQAAPLAAGEATWRGSKMAQAGVMDDRVEQRLQDMDEEGVDVHFLTPTSWTSLVGQDDVALEVGVTRAFHRYEADYCGHSPARLKGVLVASTRDVAAGVNEINQWGKAAWAAAVMPLMSPQVPLDAPDLEPLWQAAAEHDLPIVHHSVTWNPPYFPGIGDIWDSVFLGRLASHPWGAMRFVAAFIGAGICDRYPDLRMGILESGFGWLPFWAQRMDEQAEYVGGVSAARRPSDYLKSGRFFCSISAYEGEEMFAFVSRSLGDDVLMYASDYPHPECRFPDSPAAVLDWSGVPAASMQKLLAGNASRCFKS